jgi:hypothetical protein
MAWNTIPLAAAASLSIAAVAVFFAVFEGTFFFRQRKLTTNAWSAIFSLSAAGFSFFSFLQYIGPATLLQQQFDRAQFTFLILMAHSFCGYTFASLKISGRWYHRIGSPLFLAVAGVLWLTDLICSRTLISRPFAWLPWPYVETAPGPLDAPFMALLVATSLFALFFWVRTKTRDKADRIILGTGLSLFILLGIHDALVTNGIQPGVLDRKSVV